MDTLTTSEAAAVLGVTPGRVRQLYLSGELSGEKRGRDLFFPRNAVEKFRKRPVGRPKSITSKG